MAPPLVALKDVRLADGPRFLFAGVDLAIAPRERACLVGANGAGKSTLLRLLAGQIAADAGERTVQPSVRIALLAQEPELTGETLLDYVTAGGAEAHEAAAALDGFGLDPSRGTFGLSGGEARRAALARVLAEAPDVLLLDEPTNHLDILAIAQLETLIARHRGAVLTVSHDRAFLERTTQRCFWLEDARVRRLDKGFADFDDWAEAERAAKAEEARRLDKSLAREQRWLERGVTARRARNEGRRRRLLALRAEKSQLMGERRGGLELSAGEGPLSGRRVAEARRLSKRFGDRLLIKEFSTRILRGDKVAIIGPNGAGKTTLVRMLLGEEPPDSGSVKLGTRLEIVYLDQSRAGLKEDLTLWDILAPGGGDQILVQGRPRHVAAYAKDFMFDERQLRQPVRSLSGGERNRLLIARALARPANVLVLDEPTNDLDMETLDKLEEMLAAFDGAVILVSHDRDFIERLAGSTIALDGRGRVVETPGGWSDFLKQNPGFFDPSTAPATSENAASAKPAAKAPSGRIARAAARLSFKDQRRLSEIEALMERAPADITRLEETLGDPALYARDPALFAATSARLEAIRAELHAAEEEWLTLELRRESLAAPRA